MTENIDDFDYSHYKILGEKIILRKDEEGKEIKTIIKIVQQNRKKKLSEEEIAEKAEKKKEYLKKYAEENREEINKRILETNKNRYRDDAEYREYIKQKRKEYYHKTKK
jgi:hypothetical protein